MTGVRDQLSGKLFLKDLNNESVKLKAKRAKLRNNYLSSTLCTLRFALFLARLTEPRELLPRINPDPLHILAQLSQDSHPFSYKVH